VFTFNDEVAARIASPLKIEAVIQAVPLLALLSKLPEDELNIEVAEDGLKVKGEGRQATILVEKKLLLPIEDIEQPGKWRKVPDELLEALKVVSSCCGSDDAHFVLTCVHVAGDRVEASDDYQVIYFPIETGVKKSFSLKKDSVAKLISAEVTEWSFTENWVHFKSLAGMTMSCRRYVEDYPDIAKHLDVKGQEAKFPKDIDGALDKAQIFSADDPTGNKVTVSLSPGRLRLEGKGPAGNYREQRKIEYSGASLSFCIEPKLLSEISRKSDKCTVGSGRIKVAAPKFTYVTCTAPIEE
jgi:hypothetical protein